MGSNGWIDRHRFIFLGCLWSLEILTSTCLNLDQCRTTQPPPIISRRQILTERITNDFLFGVTATTSSAVLCWSSSAESARAARGAAELDLEYYLRDAFGGNPKQGSVGASAPPPLPPPRTIQEPLLSLLLNDECSIACTPCRALVKQLQKRNELQDQTIETDIQRRMISYRDGPAGRSFGRRAMWKVPHVSDQYYFELTSYALWRAAADLLPNYVDRYQYMRSLGNMLYKELVDTRLINETLAKPVPLSRTNKAMAEILDLFATSGFIKGYRFTDKQDKSPEAAGTSLRFSDVFDEYDDDDFASGASVNCLISVYEPATLGACLQLTGEQSRFWPDFIAPTLAAMWEAAVPGIQVNWEVYFVDSTYRPNPKDYFPDEQLFQFTLAQV